MAISLEKKNSPDNCENMEENDENMDFALIP
jgi:hypothetical protein